MLRRFFQRPKPPSAEEPTPPRRAVGWQPLQTPYLNYFNVHFYRVTPEQLEPALRRTYLAGAAPRAPAALMVAQGAWTSVYVEPGLALSVGFNRLASELARELDTWAIGYRIYAGEGMDVHYFRGDAHLDGLALSGETLVNEPTSAELFAALADVSGVVPRPAEQHPLDFHFALLGALGVREAALTWEAALEQHRSGAWAQSRLLVG